MIDKTIKYAFDNYISVEEKESEIYYVKDEYIDFIKNLFDIKELYINDKDINEIFDYTKEVVVNLYNEKLQNNENLKDYQKPLILSIIDKYWVEHLDLMEQLQKSVPLQAIGQKDPVKVYTVEAYEIFDEMNRNIMYDSLKHIFCL